ncbi:hypothetical protein [Xylella fastidiosa]|uniref:hypothetical protein n=1 Tax=Xylella fastidiosa TaxID=2371 RepID=UPI001E5C94B4|nr:hypothetical protein [Xylella fastidiosa]
MNKTIDFSNAGGITHAGWKNRSFWRADQQGEVKNKCRQIPRPWFGAYGVFVHGGRAFVLPEVQAGSSICEDTR